MQQAKGRTSILNGPHSGPGCPWQLGWTGQAIGGRQCRGRGGESHRDGPRGGGGVHGTLTSTVALPMGRSGYLWSPDSPKKTFFTLKLWIPYYCSCGRNGSQCSASPISTRFSPHFSSFSHQALSGDLLVTRKDLRKAKDYKLRLKRKKFQLDTKALGLDFSWTW